MAALLLASLFGFVGTNAIRAALGKLAPVALAIPLAIVLLDALVRAESWRRLLHLHGVVATRSAVVASHLAGTAWGVFVPSSLGTDAARSWLLSRRGVAGSSSVSSMLGLNLLNLFAVLLLSSGGALALHAAPEFSALRLGVPVLCAAYAAAFLLLLSESSPLPRLRAVLSRRAAFARVAHASADVAEELHALRAHPRSLVMLLGIALLNQLLSVATLIAVARALAIELPPFAALLVVPLFTLARLLPVSVAGLGGDQVASVALFGAVGVGAAEAAAISLLQAAVVDAFALFCGAFALLQSAWEARRAPR